MAQVVTEEFRQSIKSSPTSKRRFGTMFDEIYAALESSESALDKTIQTIGEFHGPWTGGSMELLDFVSFSASKSGIMYLIQQATQIANSIKGVQKAIKNMPKSVVGKFNPEVASTMHTPLLREFTNRIQKLHPAVNMYIQQYISSFPYFQSISEDVGSLATPTINNTAIDLLKTLIPGGLECLTKSTRLDRKTSLKLPAAVFGVIELSKKLTDTLYLRSKSKENDLGFLFPKLSSILPFAHGHNNAPDVFNGKKALESVGQCLAVIVCLAKDLLRLVNKFFCIDEKSRYSVERFPFTTNEGPFGETMDYIVDRQARPMYDGDNHNFFTDPTNFERVGTLPEYKDQTKSEK